MLLLILLQLWGLLALPPSVPLPLWVLLLYPRPAPLLLPLLPLLLSNVLVHKTPHQCLLQTHTVHYLSTFLYFQILFLQTVEAPDSVIQVENSAPLPSSSCTNFHPVTAVLPSVQPLCNSFLPFP